MDLGAVDEVVEPEELVPRAIRIAMEWGRWSDQSKRSTKQLLDSQSSTFFETQLEFERMLITESSRLPDFAEGVASFLEKRDPIFHSSDESE